MVAKAPTIVEAMRHKVLFGRSFAKPSWDRWRAFVGALFGLPLDEDQAALFRECTGRATLPAEPFREAALVCGRRAGKSRVLALVAAYLATMVDHRPHLDAGEVGTIAIIASDRKQARTCLRYVLGLLRDSPELASLIEAEDKESVTLSNQVVIEVHSASFRVTRSYTLIAVLADEIAFWRSEEGAANLDAEIIRAVRPGMLSIPHSMLLLASSPYSKRGVLWDSFRRNYAVDDSRVLVWRGSTERMNPKVDAARIAEAREADPSAAAAEFDAQFREDIQGFLTRDQIDAAIEAGRTVRPPIPGTRYVAFADPSSGAGDAFTAAIGHLDRNVAVLDSIYERRAPFSPASAVGEIAELLRSYGLRTVTGDKYAAGFVVEAFKEAGVQYKHSDRDRSTIYVDVLAMFNSGRISLLDNARMAAQFAGLERRTGAGRDRVDHGPGAHDDIANSVAGCLTLLRTKPPMKISQAALDLASTPVPGTVGWRQRHGQFGRFGI